MKKFLSLLGLIAIFAMTTPAYAGGHGHGPNSGFHGAPESHRPAPPQGNWNAPPPPHRHYRGSAVIGGVLARRSYWGYRDCYYDRLGWCDDFYYPPAYYRGGVYINPGISIRF